MRPGAGQSNNDFTNRREAMKTQYMNHNTGEIYRTQREAVDAWTAGETIKVFCYGSKTVMFWVQDDSMI